MSPNSRGNRAGQAGQGGNRPGPGGRGNRLGPGGECICLTCNITVPHEQGIPCTEMTCPRCGAPLTRQR
ncbi:hypothetical protein JXQ70_02925 [bacterium]|nr:hypothetical protein [bacterium]